MPIYISDNKPTVKPRNKKIWIIFLIIFVLLGVATGILVPVLVSTLSKDNTNTTPVDPSIPTGQKPTVISTDDVSFEISSNSELFTKLCNSEGDDQSISFDVIDEPGDQVSITKDQIKQILVGDETEYGVISVIGDNFLENCTSLSQVFDIPSTITTIGDNFMNNCSSYNSGINLSHVTSFGINFLKDCSSFNSAINFGSSPSIASISDNFLKNCSAYNLGITLPNTITSIGKDFLENCTSFDSNIITSNVEIIDVSFLENCTSFNKPLTLPSSLLTISDNFMSGCVLFNNDLTLPSSLTGVGEYFMSECDGFSSILNVGDLDVEDIFTPSDNTLSTTNESSDFISSGLDIEGDSCFTFINKFKNFDALDSKYRNLKTDVEDDSTTITYTAGSYNDTTIEIKDNESLINSLCDDEESDESVIFIDAHNKNISIRKDDLIDFSFGSTSSIPASIGDNFLCNFTSFVQPLTIPNGVETIGDNFMKNLDSYNANVTLDNSVEEIGDGFMEGCTSFDSTLTYLGLNTIGSSFLEDCALFDRDLNFPSGLNTIGSNFLDGCINFDKEVDLKGVITISDDFLANCSSFNSEIIFNDNTTSIGNNFLDCCNSYNVVLELPSSISSIGVAFLHKCSSFTSLVNFNQINADSIDDSIDSFSSDSDSDDCYVEGIAVVGENRDNILTKFGNSQVSYFRKLIAPPCVVYDDSGISKFAAIVSNDDLFSNLATNTGTCNFDLYDTGSISISMNTIKEYYIGQEDIFTLSPITMIDDNFLNGASSFVGEINLPVDIMQIGDNFLRNCTNFNKSISLSDSINDIGNAFLSNCSSFNSDLSLPSNNSSFTIIKNSFLVGCTSFDKPLILPNYINTIKQGFMAGCGSFSKTLDISNTAISSANSIEQGFMSSCDNFSTLNIGNKPANIFYVANNTLSSTTSTARICNPYCLIIGANSSDVVTNLADQTSTPYRKLGADVDVPSLTSSGTKYYLSNNQDLVNACCNYSNVSFTDYSGISRSFNKNTISDISFGDGNKFGFVSSIGDFFCMGFWNLNCSINFDLIANGSLTIGVNFMYNCTSFNGDITFPNNITSIGENFMMDCSVFNKNITFINITNNSIPDSFMCFCSEFNSQISIPNSIIIFGEYFMNECTSFNQDIASTIFENSLSSPRTYKLSFFVGCVLYNHDILLEPTRILYIEDSFFYRVDAYTSRITINIDDSKYDYDTEPIYFLSSNNANSKLFNPGITMMGSDLSSFKTHFPEMNNYSGKYRHYY